jgi:hypothetical protein
MLSSIADSASSPSTVSDSDGPLQPRSKELIENETQKLRTSYRLRSMNFIQNKIQANNGRQPSGRLPGAIKDHLPDSTPVEQVKSCVLERPEISSATISSRSVCNLVTTEWMVISVHIVNYMMLCSRRILMTERFLRMLRGEWRLGDMRIKLEYIVLGKGSMIIEKQWGNLRVRIVLCAGFVL